MLKKLQILAVLLVVIVVVRHLFIYPTSPDSYLHFGIGRFIVEHSRLPAHNDLSYKSVDKSMELYPHSWLADILLYSFAGTSHAVMALLLLLPLFLGAAYITYKNMTSLRISVQAQLIAGSLFSILLITYWRANPIMFAVVLTTAIVHLTVVSANKKLRLYSLPVLFILFANLAGGYVLLALLYLLTRVLVALLTYFIHSLRSEKKSHHKQHTEIGIKESFTDFCLGTIASLINPFGYKILLYPFTLLQVLQRNWFSTLPGILQATNTNIVKTNISTLPYSLYLIYALTLVITLIILLLRRPQILETANRPLPLVMFLVYGFIWVRFIPLSVAGSLVLFAVIVEEAKGLIPLPRSFLKQLKYAAVLGIILAAEYLTFMPIRFYTVGFPTNAVNFVKRNRFRPNALPSYEYANYVYYAFYPQTGFLDVQDDLFDENESIGLYTYAQTIPRGFIDNLANKYNVNTVISSQDADYLSGVLSVHPDWELFYLDSEGIVFARKKSVTRSFLDSEALSRIDLNRALGYDPKHATEAAQQLNTFIRNNPETDLARGELASVYRIQHKYDEAEQILNSIPENRRNFIFMTEMGRLKAAEGLCKESEYWLLQAVNERHEQNISRAVLDLAVLYAGCFKDNAKATHYFKRYNSFSLPPGERQFVQKLMRDFNITLEAQ